MTPEARRPLPLSPRPNAQASPPMSDFSGGHCTPPPPSQHTSGRREAQFAWQSAPQALQVSPRHGARPGLPQQQGARSPPAPGSHLQCSGADGPAAGPRSGRIFPIQLQHAQGERECRPDRRLRRCKPAAGAGLRARRCRPLPSTQPPSPRARTHAHTRTHTQTHTVITVSPSAPPPTTTTSPSPPAEHVLWQQRRVGLHGRWGGAAQHLVFHVRRCGAFVPMRATAWVYDTSALHLTANSPLLNAPLPASSPGMLMCRLVCACAEGGGGVPTAAAPHYRYGASTW